MKYILTIAFVAISAPVLAQKSIDLNDVYVQSDVNAGYILSHIGQTIPTWKKASPGSIDCGLRELKSSGMFEKIGTDLVSVGAGKHDLRIKPVYKGDPATYRVQEIVIDGSLGIDEKSLLDQLTMKNVKPGSPFMPYSDLSRSIFSAIDSVDTGEAKSLFKEVWINAYLYEGSSIRLVITKVMPECRE
jgi:hypothetical protein